MLQEDQLGSRNSNELSAACFLCNLKDFQRAVKTTGMAHIMTYKGHVSQHKSWLVSYKKIQIPKAFANQSSQWSSHNLAHSFIGSTESGVFLRSSETPGTEEINWQARCWTRDFHSFQGSSPELQGFEVWGSQRLIQPCISRCFEKYQQGSTPILLLPSM